MGPMIGFLLSYWYFRTKDIGALLAECEGPPPPLFCDSGAFTAYAQGKRIDVHDYGAWLLENRGHFTAYASLDVKGDVRQTRRNQRILERIGVQPIPVFHGGEQWGTLRAWCRDYDYVAIGGMAGSALRKTNPRMRAWLGKVFDIAGDTKLHAFGVNDWATIRALPWHSVDNSANGVGFRYGVVRLFDPYSHRWVIFPAADRRAWRQHGWLVREYGFEPAQFDGDRLDTRVPQILLAGRCWARAARTVPGTQLYLVDAANGQREGRWGDGDKRRLAVWHHGANVLGSAAAPAGATPREAGQQRQQRRDDSHDPRKPQRDA